MSAGPRTIVVAPAAQGRRLDVMLAAEIADVSRSQLARQITLGAVTVNGERTTPSRKLRAGDVIAWAPPPPTAVDLVAEEIPLQIVHEDRWLVVVNKPPGLVVHPAPGHQAGTLVNALLAHCRDLRGIGGELRPGIVHRIDKDTSGLLVVAKDDATMAALGAAFKVHDIKRVYDALLVGRPAQGAGQIDTLHGRDPRDRKKFTTKVRTGRRAITDWRVVELLEGATRVQAELKTGRTHQVRVHFAGLGHPLLGDAVYGRLPREPALRTIAAALGRQALHARTLGFTHPGTKKWLELEAEPPADFQRALDELRALSPKGRR